MKHLCPWADWAAWQPGIRQGAGRFSG